MTMTTLRGLIEERLNDDTIVVVREGDSFGKEIYFNYDAEKVASVKTLSRREYCPAEKLWRSKAGVSEIKEKLQDYKLDFLFFFDKIEDAAKYMIEDDFYMHHQDINFVLTTSIIEDEKDFFIEKFLKPHGLTIDETKKVVFENHIIEREYICLKLA